MPTTLATLNALVQPTRLRGGYPVTPNARGRIKHSALSDALLRCIDGIVADSHTALLTSDGTSGSTVTLYRVDIAAGAVVCGGVVKSFAAAADTVLLGTGTWDKSIALDGAAPAALDDGDTYYVVIIAVSIASVPTLYAIFGDAALDGAETLPTDDELRDALVAADITNDDGLAAHVLDVILVQRSSTTITMTHTDPAAVTAAGDELKAARMGHRNLYGEQVTT